MASIASAEGVCEEQAADVAVIGKAFVAPGGGEHEAAGADDLRGGGPAFDGLGEILIERAAAGGGAGDGESVRARDPEGFAHLGATGAVGGEGFTAEKAGDRAVGFEGDVDEKIDGPERAAGAHVGLGGVVFETAQVLVISPITGAA